MAEPLIDPPWYFPCDWCGSVRDAGNMLSVGTQRVCLDCWAEEKSVREGEADHYGEDER